MEKTMFVLALGVVIGLIMALFVWIMVKLASYGKPIAEITVLYLPRRDHCICCQIGANGKVERLLLPEDVLYLSNVEYASDGHIYEKKEAIHVNGQ
jgi:hypothetical protein